MPLTLNSESVFSREHQPEDNASLLAPLSKDFGTKEEKARRFPHKMKASTVETPSHLSPRLQGSDRHQSLLRIARRMRILREPSRRETMMPHEIDSGKTRKKVMVSHPLLGVLKKRFEL